MFLSSPWLISSYSSCFMFVTTRYDCGEQSLYFSPFIFLVSFYFLLCHTKWMKLFFLMSRLNMLGENKSLSPLIIIWFRTDSPLAQLYGSQATLEHHHINLTIMIMNSDGNNIFESLSTDQYSSLMIIIKKSILATDLTHHIQ